MLYVYDLQFSGYAVQNMHASTPFQVYSADSRQTASEFPELYLFRAWRLFNTICAYSVSRLALTRFTLEPITATHRYSYLVMHFACASYRKGFTLVAWSKTTVIHNDTYTRCAVNITFGLEACHT